MKISQGNSVFSGHGGSRRRRKIPSPKG